MIHTSFRRKNLPTLKRTPKQPTQILVLRLKKMFFKFRRYSEKHQQIGVPEKIYSEKFLTQKRKQLRGSDFEFSKFTGLQYTSLLRSVNSIRNQ